MAHAQRMWARVPVDRVAVAADDDVLAIRAQVGVRRHDAGDGRSRRLAHHTLAVVLGHDSFHQIEDRLIDGHVDHLAADGLTALPPALLGGGTIVTTQALSRGMASQARSDLAVISPGRADRAWGASIPGREAP